MENNKEEKNKIEFIQKNSGWIIAAITGVGIIFSSIFGFIEYITASAYFSFYGLDINLYNYGDKGFIYSLILSLIFMLALYSIIYCIKQIKNSINKFKSNWKIILEDFFIIILSNLYISFSLSFKLDKQSFTINFIFILLCEIVSCFIITNQTKKINDDFDMKFEIINYFKRLPFLIIIFLILIILRTNLNLYCNKEYRIIEGNKVIAYSSENYYLVLNCEIKDNNITIFKGTQTKINNLNVESKIYKFKTKELK